MKTVEVTVAFEVPDGVDPEELAHFVRGTMDNADYDEAAEFLGEEINVPFVYLSNSKVV